MKWGREWQKPLKKCKLADQYQAIYPPKCGCGFCRKKYLAKIRGEKEPQLNECR